jgi:GT2 family glycosyltransferase
MMGVPNVIDVIILSYAQSPALFKTTVDCINSLLTSEDLSEIQFRIVVIESEKKLKPYKYKNATTIYPDEPFGYHRYMNIGIQMTSSPFVCLCNNDLIFHPDWASEMLKVFNLYPNLLSASPACSIHHPKMGIPINSGVLPGYRIRYEVAGWCLFVRREIFKIIGELDENYKFWCADNDYANTLWVLNIGHVLVTSSVVDHLESKTLYSQSADIQEKLTEQEVFYFDKKWKHRLG